MVLKKNTFRNLIQSVWTGMQLLSESRDSFIWLQIYLRPNCVQAEITRGKNYYGLKLDICFTESIHIPSTHHPFCSGCHCRKDRECNKDLKYYFPTQHFQHLQLHNDLKWNCKHVCFHAPVYFQRVLMLFHFPFNKRKQKKKKPNCLYSTLLLSIWM